MSAISSHFDPENTQNPEDLEGNFVMSAVRQMTTYWKLLEAIPGSKLKLTKIDDEIYEHFKKEFPEIDPAAPLDVNEMKGDKGKVKWRNFMNSYKGKVDDFDMGTMLRLSPKDEYDEKGTVFSYRMQVYAIEIARNRTGANDWVHEKAHTKKT